MARTTVYNNITSPEKIELISDENKYLMREFVDYLQSIDRAQSTIEQYKHDLNIFFVWNAEHNDNTWFTKVSKREFAKFQAYALNEWNWSPNRIRRVKAVLSSLSNYIENILDEEEEFQGYRSVVRKIESPAKEEVREKTIITNEEVQMILDTLVEQEKYQLACLFALAAFGGARKSELLRYKVSYFDDENIMSTASLYRSPEKIKTKGRGKNGKQLYKYTLLDFKKYYDLWMAERQRLGIEDECLFVNKNGDPLSVGSMDNYAEYFSKLLGRPFYWHSLRHQLCTRLFKLGLPANVIQEYFGWSSIEMTSVYNDSDASDTFGQYFTSDGIKGSDARL